MAKLTLDDLANLNNQTSAVTTINDNNALIEAALEKTLSRDGTTPNQMQTTLDMNSNRVYNLPRATLSTEPVRYSEFLAAVTDGADAELDNIIANLPMVAIFESRQDVEAADVSDSYSTLITHGYLEAGDGGGATYLKVVSEPAHVGKVQSNDGAWWEISVLDELNLRCLGWVTDGVTDNWDILKDALEIIGAGKRVLIPAGGTGLIITTNSETPDSTITIAPAVGTILCGETYASNLTIRCEDSLEDASYNLFVITSNYTMENFEFVIEEIEGTTGPKRSLTVCLLAGVEGEVSRGCYIRRMHLDGGITELSPQVDSYGVTWSCQLFSAAFAEDFEDIWVVDCDIENWGYGWLKTNGSTSTQRHIRVINNRCRSFWRPAWSFNTPQGVIQDIVVAFNEFQDNFGAVDSSGADYWVGTAHGKDMKCVYNTARGVFQQFFHGEESCDRAIISFNTIVADSVNADGIKILPNNVSTSTFSAGTDTITVEGTYVHAHGVVIEGNSFKGPGKGVSTTGRAIHMVNSTPADDTGEPGEIPGVPADVGIAQAAVVESIIKGNVVSGFKYGIYAPNVNDGIKITDNYVHSCTTGIFRSVGSLDTLNNTIDSCTTGYETSTGGGCFGYTSFRGTITTWGTASGGKVSVKGWDYDIIDVDLPATTTTQIAFCPSGTSLQGKFLFDYNQNTTVHRQNYREVRWDDSFVTQDVEWLESGSGGVTINTPGVTQGSSSLRLAMHNTTGAAVNNGRLQIHFDGVHVL